MTACWPQRRGPTPRNDARPRGDDACDLIVDRSMTGRRVPVDFVALIKAHPGEHTLASTGVGTTTHLPGELMKASLGLKMTHVHSPARGRRCSRCSAAICRSHSPRFRRRCPSCVKAAIREDTFDGPAIQPCGRSAASVASNRSTHEPWRQADPHLAKQGGKELLDPYERPAAYHCDRIRPGAEVRD